MTTAREMVETLTGFEEDAVEAMCGMTFDALAMKERDLKLTRVLAATKLRREDPELTPQAAYQKIQAMRQNELLAVFEDEPDDPMPDEPDSEAGKDDSTPPPEHTSSPTSASQLV
jgi:hypothetical protein